MDSDIETPLERAQQLYECCIHNDLPSKYVMMDYFGCETNRPKQKLILGLYKTLFFEHDVSPELLANCYESNRLNDLIHKKFEKTKTKCYKQFCGELKHLRQTCLDPLPREDWLEI